VIQENWLSEVAIPGNAFKKTEGSASLEWCGLSGYFFPTQDPPWLHSWHFYGNSDTGTEVLLNPIGFFSA
jgi:hypothetical protein